MTSIEEHIQVIFAARDRRGRNVFVDETRWAPRDPKVPHAFEPRRYYSGSEWVLSDACWCDALLSRAVHEVVA